MHYITTIIAVCQGGAGCRLRVSVFPFEVGEASLAFLSPRSAGLARLPAAAGQAVLSVLAAGASRLDLAVDEKARRRRLQPGGPDQLQLP